MSEKIRHLFTKKLLLGITFLLIFSCEPDLNNEDDEPLSSIEKRRIEFLSLNEFQSRFGFSEDYRVLSKYFEVNIEDYNFMSKSEGNVTSYLLTDEIAVITKQNVTYATFRIETDSTSIDFYNFVIVIDESGNVLSTNTLKYTPNDIWLADRTKPFEGHVTLDLDGVFTIEDFNQQFQQKSSNQCITDITNEWVCYDYQDVPNPPGFECIDWEWVVTVVYGNCPPTISDGDEEGVPVDPHDPSPGGGGGSGSGSGTNNDDDDCIPAIDNPCDEDSTTILTPPDDNDENDDGCESLRAMMKTPPNSTNPHTLPDHPENQDGLNTKIRLAITNIGSDLNNDDETGFGFYNRGNFLEYGPYAHHVPAAANNRINFPNVGYQFGTLHTHPDNGEAIPMFSHNDMYSLLSIRNSYTPFLSTFNSYGDALFVSVLVVKQAGMVKTYAIKIKDFQAFETAMNRMKSTRTDWKQFGKLVKEKFKNDAGGITGTPMQYQQAFLELVQNQNLGLDLYEMEQTGAGTQFVQENWKRLSLDASNNVTENPCD
jgi:hypothetical protein